jgi:hypothetical protein
MPAPRKRAPKSSTATTAAEDQAPDINIGDMSHLDEAAANGYVGELGDEGTNPDRVED